MSTQRSNDHVTNVPDGAGCAEIWEHLSEHRVDTDDVSDVSDEDVESPLSKLVLEKIREKEAVFTVRDLKDVLGIPCIRLYPVIDVLADKFGLVERYGDYVWAAEFSFGVPVATPPGENAGGSA